MSATFDPISFAEGRFRLAYKGTHTAPPSRRGDRCVVKENKESYTWKSTDWDMSVKIQDMSKDLAKQFNKVHNCSRSIVYTDASVWRVTSSTGKPKLNEYVLVEDYLPGDFSKWCNNYGYISPNSELMPAFMHWSWVHSRGEFMIADLQGVLNSSKNTYHLTDPVLMSNTEGGKYGCTDTGVEGIAMFFLKHTCNKFCPSGLPKPTVADVLGPSAAFQLQLQSLMTSTAYSHELKFPPHVRKTMISVFPQVATRQY